MSIIVTPRRRSSSLYQGYLVGDLIEASGALASFPSMPFEQQHPHLSLAAWHLVLAGFSSSLLRFACGGDSGRDKHEGHHALSFCVSLAETPWQH
jgi:hypothetical protein